MTISSETFPTLVPPETETWRGRIVRGSAILLLSTALVALTNLLYNLILARMLGAAGFGHASALYTLLMLVSAIPLAFQIVTSKFIARSPDVGVRAQIYARLLRRSWQSGLVIALLILVGSGQLQTYLNLPAQRDLLLLALAAGIYIPLGVQRGRLQGECEFGGLALNVIVEAVVKLGTAVLFLRFGMGVTGVMVAILLSIVAAYGVTRPGPEYRAKPSKTAIAPFGEGIQATSYFIGQVVLSNLDILLVKHFFAAAEAGVYAAIALVGRVVFMLSWSVVSSMFPISAGSRRQEAGRSVLYTALLLVSALITGFVLLVWMAPESVWNILLGKHFFLQTSVSFSKLLTQYGFMTGIYSVAVVMMMYEISRRIGKAAWIQLLASLALALAIWRYHESLSQVIMVQAWVMSGLLLAVTIPLAIERSEEKAEPPGMEAVKRIRKVSEDEVISEFLRGEFCHREFDDYREEFKTLVERHDLAKPEENAARRALLYLRRGKLWRELPRDTEWWEVELTAEHVQELQSFPRNEWKRFAGGRFYLREIARQVEEELKAGRKNRLLTKLGEIAADLREKEVPDAVLLIGTTADRPLTIIEGNHRMLAAMLAMPAKAHQRFRFYCGFSQSMDYCCWHATNAWSTLRYAAHGLRYWMQDRDSYVRRALRKGNAPCSFPANPSMAPDPSQGLGEAGFDETGVTERML